MSSASFDWTPLQRALTDFVASHDGRYRVLELWLDTSIAKAAPDRSAPSLYLVAHAFEPFSADLEPTFAKIAETGDLGFLEDAQKDVSEQLSFELTHVHPDLSTGQGFLSHAGAGELTRALGDVVASPGFARFTDVFWYWVGSTDFVWIRRRGAP